MAVGHPGGSPRRFLHEVTPSPSECRHARRRLGWSVEQLARASGVSRRTLIDYEEGLRTPRAGTLIAVRRALRAGAPAAKAQADPEAESPR